MPEKYKPVEVRPRDGGNLMSNASSDNAGLLNYVTKRNWRRDIDKEIRREGYDYFYPNVTGDFASNPAGQPFPGQLVLTSLTLSVTTVTATRTNGHHFENGETIIISGADQPQYNGEFVISSVTKTTFQYNIVGSPASPATGTIRAAPKETINLWHLARRPNGKTAVICGSARRLYRFFALEDGRYFDSDYFAGDGTPAEYFETNPGEWIVIGWGYSTSGNRWEAVCINGTSVFNNGVDLLQTYRVEDLLAKPLYELREQGIASVGTIWEHDGILMCGDISEIFEDQLEDLFSFLGSVESGDITATQAGNTVTSNAPFFGGKVVSITRVGATATATVPEHGFQNGWQVTIAGATQPEYNGTFIIGGVTTNTFTFAVGGAPATPATGDISVSDMVGKTVIFGRTIRNITVYTNRTTVTVDGAPQTVATPFTITVRTRASQTGSDYSGLVTADVAAAGTTVTSSAAFFAPAMVGQDIRFSNGFSRQITAFIDPSNVTIAAPGPISAIDDLTFWIVDDNAPAYADLLVNSTASIFRTEMVDTSIVWDDGNVRKIVALLSPTQVRVSSDLTVPLGIIGIENPATYARYTETGFINRIQYRMIWSMVDEPDRFAAVFPGTIGAGSRTLTLDYPVLSLENGDSIIISGAGVAGGNLTANIVFISSLGKVLLLDAPASTTVASASVQRSDSVGSIVGFQDLQGDSSGILKGLMLGKTSAIYKDTAIFLATYTGIPATPFIWTDLEIPEGDSLFYRFTLACVKTNTHIYAGRNAFYKFELSSQKPEIMPLFELCSNVFFSQATLENTNLIFAADSSPTKEIFFVFPSTSEEKGLVYDYKQNTASTVGFTITAAATLKKPVAGIATGATEDWFVLGMSNGVALVYGKTDQNQNMPGWSNGKEIFYQRAQNPYATTQADYDSDLIYGMSPFGSSFNEKDVRSIVTLLASNTPVPSSSLRSRLLGCRNVDEVATLLADYTNANPDTTNLFPVFFRQNYFQLRLTVNGNRAFRLVGNIWEFSGVASRSFIRKA